MRAGAVVRRAAAVLITVAALLLPVDPAAAATPCAACVGVIGDSLTYQGGRGPSRITAKLAAAGIAASDIRVDAKTGRSIAGGAVRPSSLDVIRAWRAAGFDPALYVVALGTNNKNATVTAWRREISKVLAEIGPGRRILWIGMGFRNAADPRVARFNATLADIAATRTDLVVGEWNNHVHSYPQTRLWASGDRQGIHMTTAGYDIRNDYYVASTLGVRSGPG